MNWPPKIYFDKAIQYIGKVEDFVFIFGFWVDVINEVSLGFKLVIRLLGFYEC